MFIISSTSQMANYTAGFATESQAYASMQSVDCAEEAGELGALHFQSACVARNSKNSTCSITSNGSGSGGGLRRSMSSMHGSLDSYHHHRQPAVTATTTQVTSCTHTSQKSGGCIVEAKQVEMVRIYRVSQKSAYPPPSKKVLGPP